MGEMLNLREFHVEIVPMNDDELIVRLDTLVTILEVAERSLNGDNTSLEQRLDLQGKFAVAEREFDALMQIAEERGLLTIPLNERVA